jgi:hypothetical protein
MIQFIVLILISNSVRECTRTMSAEAALTKLRDQYWFADFHIRLDSTVSRSNDCCLFPLSTISHALIEATLLRLLIVYSSPYLLYRITQPAVICCLSRAVYKTLIYKTLSLSLAARFSERFIKLVSTNGH